MADKEFLPEEINEIEQALASLKPKQSGIDRDRLLYLSGQASVAHPASVSSRSPRIWKLTTMLSTTAAVVLGFLLAVRAEPEVVREIQYVEIDRPQNDLHPLLTDTVPRENPQDFASDHSWNNEFYSEPNYLQLRTVALERGVDAFASLGPDRSESFQNSSPNRPTMSYRSGLQDLLEQNRKTQPETNQIERETPALRGEQL